MTAVKVENAHAVRHALAPQDGFASQPDEVLMEEAATLKRVHMRVYGECRS